MSRKILEEMGVPASKLLAELKELVEAHTVNTGEGGKTLTKPIHPTRADVLALASKVVDSSHLAGVEAWVEKQLVALL